MVCDIYYHDGPMTAAQMFTYVRHMHGDIWAYFVKDKDLVIIPIQPGIGDTLDDIREMAFKKGLCCSEVNAIWPEYIDGDILSAESASDYLVINEVRGKYMQVY